MNYKLQMKFGTGSASSNLSSLRREILKGTLVPFRVRKGGSEWT